MLLTADYSQIELRLMAHFSQDSSLIDVLSKPDGDVFIMIASRWTSKQECMVSSQERDQTKRLVYGILYGMGANTLAEQLECSSEEAAEKIKSFKVSFPGVSSWLQEVVASCRHKGSVSFALLHTIIMLLFSLSCICNLIFLKLDNKIISMKFMRKFFYFMIAVVSVWVAK